MRPLAPLSREYAWYAATYGAVGAAGLAADALLRGAPTRTFAVGLVMAAITVAVLGVTNLRWLRDAVRSAPQAPPDAVVEARSATIRRLLPEAGAVAVLVGLALAGRAGLGALMAGIALGSGAMNAVGAGWLRRAPDAHRETPATRIAAGRRAVWRCQTLPASDSTERA